MWNNTKISTKIIASFCLVFALLGWAVHMEYVGLMKVEDHSGKVGNMQAIVKNVLEARRQEKNLIIRGDAVYRDNTLKAVAEIKRLAQTSKDLFQQADNKKLMDDVLSATADYEAAFHRLADMMLAGGAQKPALDEIEKPMLAAAHKVQETSEAAMKAQQTLMEEAIASAKLNSVIYSLLAVLLGGGAAFFVMRDIVRSIQHIVESTCTVAEGNLSIDKLETGASEMGQLSHSFNGMIASVSSSVHDVAATGAKISVAAYRSHVVADHINDKTTEVAIQAANVASTSKDISATSASIAQSCQFAAEGAKQASLSAQEGSAIVDNTIQVMRQIADTIGQITVE